MAISGLRQRRNQTVPIEAVASSKDDKGEEEEHPAGEIKHGGLVQAFRLLSMITFIMWSIFSMFLTQLVGAPLYFFNKDLYYAYMALTKQSFGILLTTVTQVWGPVIIRVSGDASVADELKKLPDGRLECAFPERLVMIANHQLYSDWLYLWWVGYTNRPRMHGHIYIILKESLKRIPIIGLGMMFYGFIFMSRNMEKDRPRLAHRLEKLKAQHDGPMSGSKGLDPMWLLVFPEGTNASNNGRKKSAAWAEKTGIKDMQHQLLPRSTGMYFCLTELADTVEYVYDCTMAYEGIGRGKYGQDYYSLRTMYLQGRQPPSVNMYWRRFAVNDIPLDDAEKFELWLRDRWYEKDAFLEQHLSTGRLPAMATTMKATNGSKKQNKDFIETKVQLGHWWEIGSMFVVPAICALIANVFVRIWTLLVHGRS